MFNYTFGLDFSASPPNERNEHFQENARMHFYVLHYIATANNWIQNDDIRLQCYRLIVELTADQAQYGGYEEKVKMFNVHVESVQQQYK